MKNKPLVSVSMITYNHESFIKEAIEGVLMQETNFDYELVIADDCSPDNTQEIVNEFILNHPKGNVIRYFRHSKNIGMSANGIFAAKECKGDYIAVCEGDDYWIDPCKLQKQVDFLENNNDFILCASNSKILLNSDFIDQKNIIKYTSNTILKFENLIGDYLHNPIPTGTILFRKNLIDHVDFDFICKFSFSDWPLLIEMARFGKIYMFKDFFTVYRVHENGTWSGKTSIEQKIAVIKFYFFTADRYPEFDYLCCLQISKLIDEIIKESNFKVEQFFTEKIERLKKETQQRDFLKNNFSFKDILVVLFKKLIDKLSFLYHFK